MPSGNCVVQQVSVTGQQTYGESIFPLVLQCVASSPTLEEVRNWVAEHRTQLNQQVEEHGTVLFRGFPLKSPEDFDTFLGAFELESFAYEQSFSNAVRINYTPRVFSANEAPSEVTIFLHHEMAQTPLFPGRLFFFCQQPAEAGGATPICRSDVLFERIQQRYPKFASDCEEKGLRYSNVMPSTSDPASGMGRNWQSTFRVSTKEEAERQLQRYGYSWQWLEGDCLRATTPVLPAVRTVSQGRKTFFNQLIAAFCGWKDSRNDPSQAITFGDGSHLDREVVMSIAQLADEMTFDVPWQAGDVAFLDNYLVMHGRRTFQGSRKILASLASPETHAIKSDSTVVA